MSKKFLTLKQAQRQFPVFTQSGLLALVADGQLKIKLRRKELRAAAGEIELANERAEKAAEYQAALTPKK